MKKPIQPLKKRDPHRALSFPIFISGKMRWLSLFFTHCTEWVCLFAHRTGSLMKVQEVLDCPQPSPFCRIINIMGRIALFGPHTI